MPTVARAANVLGALSLAIADHMRQVVDDAAGARSSAPAALAALDGFLDGGSIDQLRDVVGLTSSGAVRLVDRLEHDGYVERGRGVDGRSVALHLTAEGRTVAAAVRRARTAVLDGVLAHRRVQQADEIELVDHARTGCPIPGYLRRTGPQIASSSRADDEA